MQIRDKVILITGASEGIGAACAQVLRERGALLSLTARSEDKLRLAAGADGLFTAGDITAPETRERVVARTLERYGRIDVLINNAGAGLYTPSWNSDPAHVRAMFELNVFAPIELTRLVVQSMRRRGSGMIVNVGSIAGKVTLPWLTLYSATKYAVGSLTDGLRMELKRDGIHAMTVCPGYVETRFQSNLIAGRIPPGVADSRMFAISARRCAEDIASGIERRARTVMTPRVGWLLVAAARLFPALLESRFESIHARGQSPRGAAEGAP